MATVTDKSLNDELPDVEVFCQERAACTVLHPGWYWRPGPHSRVVGPFPTEELAIADAKRDKR